MPRGDQISRQWRILRHLEHARRGLSVKELHERLEGETSERNVFRDLEHLQKAGFALVNDNGRWRVLEPSEGGHAVPLQPTELLALLVTRSLMTPLRGSDVGSALDELRKKVSAMLAPTQRRLAEELGAHMVASFTAPADYGERNETLRALEEAIHKEHSVRMTYFTASRHADSRRLVDPYTLWFADGRLYLIGFCHERRGFRIFLLDRMRNVEILDEDFDPDPDFDPQRYIRSGFGVWSGEPYDIELRFAPEVAHLTEERRLHATQRVTHHEDGAATLTMQASGLPHLASWVAGFGGDVQARTPEALVEMVRELHARGLEAYR